ncbi:hypothetical protein [Thioalkalivibrio sp. ALE17]|uniref:hypothetical protein n=1 Tax=Thioalkalivibrio sp. ALE17 TaxID=1158173 RepID=UPI0003FFE43E|nr:hypothetical protein [Thioalkalivibrio sp. ALE17]
MLESALRQLTTALRDQICPGTGLRDPEDQAPSPADHYGQVAAALALTLQEGDDSMAARHALEAWRSLAPADRGHAPFNRFLLNLLAEHRALTTGNPHDAASLRALAGECSLAWRYPSNNWALLARLCELQEAPTRHRKRVARRLLHLLSDWSHHNGAFIDYPSHPDRARTGSTPAAYHHKALFVAVAAAEYDAANDWQPTVERLLQWSLQTWDGHGHVGGLGRSNHALFGDACLVASLILLGADQAQARATPAGRMLQGIVQRWQEQTRPDGFIALNPANQDATGTGWDTYMHLSVYNAWAAAIVAWARDRTARVDRTALRIDLRASEPTATDDSHAVQFRVGDPGAVFALVSGCGQPPQAFSRSEVELRYAGGIPLHVTWQGCPLCPAPVRISREALEGNAGLAGWTPIFETEGMLYGLTDFDSCEIERAEQTVRIRLSGQPRALLRPDASGLGPRALAALDWRLLGGALGRKAALHRPKLSPVTGQLEWTIHLDRPRIEQTLILEHRSGQVVRYLNPGGHALTRTVPTEASFLAESGLAEQGQTSSTDGWLTTPLPSATADAIGRSLPPIELARGRYHAQLIVTWMSLQTACESR